MNMERGVAVKSEKLPCPGAKLLKRIPCPGAKCSLNDTQSWSFLKQNCALPWMFVRSLSANPRMLPSKRVESHSRSANGPKRHSGVNNNKYGLCHRGDYTKMKPCPGVGILKMIPCSAACPRTEKYTSTRSPPGLTELNFHVNFDFACDSSTYSSKIS